MNVSVKCPTGSSIQVGKGHTTKVMALIGTSNRAAHSAQVEKLEALRAMASPPDVVADLSIVSSSSPLWQHVLELGFAAATLPVYTARRSNARIDPNQLLDIAMQQIEGGVGLLTIHPTPTLQLIEKARSRIIPWTSRGGGMIIEDLLASDGKLNAYLKILPELISSAKSNGTTLSLGASFRSATIFDSMDLAQQSELDAQLRIASEIAAAGVDVIIESPGHARPADIRLCAERLSASGFPVMPLGPLPTDAAIGFDHVAAAIGATLMGMEGSAHILAAVTREEHTGGVPSIQSTVEAVETARIAAHVIDIHLLNETKIDAKITSHRAANHTCVFGKLSEGCSRCGSTCPL